MLAAFITSMLRATLSETLAGLPANALVCTATTDGILSSVPVEELHVNGPVAKAFAAARARLDPAKPDMWEEKHRARRVIVIKTRGTFSVDHTDGAPILARGGYRLDRRYDDARAECREWERLYRERTYTSLLLRKTLTPLSTQWLEEADLVEVVRRVRYNGDYDMKRSPPDPCDVEGLLCCDTSPWQTVEQFNEARDALEAWKKSQRRVLKTTKDWDDYIEWSEISMRQNIVGSTAQSSRPPLVNAFMRAMARGMLTSPAWSYERIAAAVSAAGFPCSIMTLKDAKRRSVLSAIRELTDEERAFAAHIHRAHEDINLAKLAAPEHTSIFRVRLIDPTLFSRVAAAGRCGGECATTKSKIVSGPVPPAPIKPISARGIPLGWTECQAWPCSAMWQFLYGPYRRTRHRQKSIVFRCLVSP
jgi:hypothetical protein